MVGQNTEKPTRQKHGWPLTLPTGSIHYFTSVENKNGCHIDYFTSVGNFVTAKAPEFNRVQQISTSGPQTFQQESLRIHKVLQSSTSFGIWFGTRRPVVQIHSPRPYFPPRFITLRRVLLHDGKL